MPLPRLPVLPVRDLFAPVQEYAKSVLRVPADEAYWFNWRSSFHGEA